MKLSESSADYLRGGKFATSYTLQMQFDRDDYQLRSRIDLLRGLAAGRKLVHVGCVDHDVATIVRKLRSDEWLHRSLVEVSARCLGIDINVEGIRYIREELGLADVEAADITARHCDAIGADTWDYLLLAELVEHIDNPVDFLTRIRASYRDQVNSLLVTVPNAFALRNRKHANQGQERINSDHRYWFTPYTISKVLTAAGFRVNWLRTCGGDKPRALSFIRNNWLRYHPLLRGSIVVEAAFQ